MAQLQLLAPPLFQPHGNPTSVAQRLTKWKKGFEYFLKASGITTDCWKRALLLHIADPDTQNVFETLTDTGTEHQHALNKLDAHFSIKKNVPFERSVFHSTTQHKSKRIEQFVAHLQKVNFMLWVWGFDRRTDSRSSHSHLQFHKTKTEIIGRARPHIRESITDRTIYGTSSASFIYHRTEINTVNLWNNKSRRIKCAPLPSPFSTKDTILKNHQKQNQNSDHRNTHQHGQKKHTSNNQIECSPCDAKGHRGNECWWSKNRTCSRCNKVGHFERMWDPKKNVASSMPSTIPLLSCQIWMQTLILTMRIYMFLK